MANLESTKNKILRVSTTMFLEVGYSKTSPQMIAKELEISTGNLTYYYPTKEHLLAVLTDLLCKFQWKLMEYEAGEGMSSLLSICLELMTMAAACEESEVAKDFFVSTYQSPKCLEIIHNNDTARAKEVFAQYCPGWTDEQFREAEILVAGIEHATLNAIDKTVPLETRISGALNAIMTIYNVPEEIRKIKIEKVLAMDYRSIGKRIFNEFKEYVEGIHNSE
ncbi:MAG: TetR/AcrR family transcriptional regulator [Clostridia bacterium]|nr:TetR/AcrR family transcriptional regulator [Clostridia bacterium]